MNIRKAQKQQAKIKMALQGPSGSGKTYSALLVANGLTSWDKICVIDTENNSADLYADLGPYNVLQVEKPFSPESYIRAITECEANGIEVIIIDSLSHEWDGDGGILDIHSSMSGNSFTNWSKVTPRHNALIQNMLSCNAHLIATLRTKQDYVLSDKNGKMVPEKVGLKSITRDGMDYEFTVVFDLDITHKASASKDRTGLFVQELPFKLSEIVGKRILNWCDNSNLSIIEQISLCTDIQALKILYYDMSLADRAKYRKEIFEKQMLLKPKFESNGATKHHN